jgi:hypothetical protein
VCREAVKDVLDDAARRIKEIKAAGAADPNQLPAVNRIAARAQSADQKDRAFGLAVVELLKSFGLHDAAILENHYLENHYQNSAAGWGALLAHYRGDVTHHSYLDILEAGHDWGEIAAIRNHLHDALAHMVLKILEFDGVYTTGIITQRVVPFSVDWVKPSVSAQELGYKY